MSEDRDQRPSRRISELFASRRMRLQAFFRRRLGSSEENYDLTQETFLRVLRADASQAIDNPEAYLFTVAGNLVREHAALRNRFATTADIGDPNIELELSDWPDFATPLDAPQRHRELLAALGELSPKCRAVVILQYRDGLTYQQIGARIGVSSNMVKKYLSQALRHCRERLVAPEELP